MVPASLQHITTDPSPSFKRISSYTINVSKYECLCVFNFVLFSVPLLCGFVIQCYDENSLKKKRKGIKGISLHWFGPKSPSLWEPKFRSK